MPTDVATPSLCMGWTGLDGWFVTEVPSDSEIQGLQAQIKVNRLSMNHSEPKPLFSAQLTLSGVQP